jgi:hypothetical protein
MKNEQTNNRVRYIYYSYCTSAQGTGPVNNSLSMIMHVEILYTTTAALVWLDERPLSQLPVKKTRPRRQTLSTNNLFIRLVSFLYLSF